MLKEALKIELGGFEYNTIRVHYLWKEVLMIICDMLEAVEDTAEQQIRLGTIKTRLETFRVDMFRERWVPLSTNEVSSLYRTTDNFRFDV